MGFRTHDRDDAWKRLGDLGVSSQIYERDVSFKCFALLGSALRGEMGPLFAHWRGSMGLSGRWGVSDSYWCPVPVCSHVGAACGALLGLFSTSPGFLSGPRSGPNALLSLSWNRFGSVWEPSWDHYETHGAILGPRLAFFGILSGTFGGVSTTRPTNARVRRHRLG